MSQLKWLMTAILAVIVVMFSVQNAATVELEFLTWTVQMRRSIVVATCIAIGLVIGWVFGVSARRR